MNAEEALMLTRIVRAAFPSQRFDEFTIDVWADALRDEDFGECREAVRRLVGMQTFASVAEVIAEAKLRRRDALRRLADQETIRAIGAARTEYDRDRSHAAYLEASALLTEKLRQKHPEEAEAAS